METAIKERPILFSGPMVRAILGGKKTVTRRIVKPQPPNDRTLGECCYSDTGWAEMDDPSTVQPAGCYCNDVPCPYGQPGDRLWVREAWRLYNASEECACYDLCLCHARHGRPMYRADWTGDVSDHKWRPSIHMPRWASRIVLEVKSVRVERLQEITEDECVAEGFDGSHWWAGAARCDESAHLVINQFQETWDQLNADRGYGWDSNPWVWRVEFERIKGD